MTPPQRPGCNAAPPPASPAFRPPSRRLWKNRALSLGILLAALGAAAAEAGEDKWEVLRGASLPANRITNPAFVALGDRAEPAGWRPGPDRGPALPARESLGGRSRCFVETGGEAAQGKAETRLGIAAGRDGGAFWESPLPACRPGETFAFSARFRRERWINGAYPRVRLWGMPYTLDQHWVDGAFQRIRVFVSCPHAADLPQAKNDGALPGRPRIASEPAAPGDSGGTFRFENVHPGETFCMAGPELFACAREDFPFPPVDDLPAAHPASTTPPGASSGGISAAPPDLPAAPGGSGEASGAFAGAGRALLPAAGALPDRATPGLRGSAAGLENPAPGETAGRIGPGVARPADAGASAGLPSFFPIGVFGANRANLEAIRSLAVNTALIGGEGESLAETVAACRRLGLRCTIAVPRDVEDLRFWSDALAGAVQPGEVSFYVNDEPELTSFPVGRAEDIRRLLANRFPGADTLMAVVRPQAVGEYRRAARFFLLDQYPVPHMPMRWLSDSLDEAAAWVGRERLMAVVQAFGGEGEAGMGWPRRPTWEEMDCLAFLAVIHGVRGIYFYSFAEMGKTREGRDALGRVVGRLNRLYAWLLVPNAPDRPRVEMTSVYGWDPQGEPAVQGCWKRRGNEALLLLTNTLPTFVSARIAGDAAAREERPGAADAKGSSGGGSFPCFARRLPAGAGAKERREKPANAEGHRDGAAGMVQAVEAFSGEPFLLEGKTLSVSFAPYETKAFLWKQ